MQASKLPVSATCSSPACAIFQIFASDGVCHASWRPGAIKSHPTFCKVQIKSRGLGNNWTLHFVQCLHGPLCKLALWTEVMWLMRCSTKCSCQNRFGNELQWCCKCHYFLNIHLPWAFFRFVMASHCATFTCQVPLASCFLLKVFLKLCMCMSKARSSPILEKIDNEGTSWTTAHRKVFMYWLFMILFHWWKTMLSWIELPVQCVCVQQHFVGSIENGAATSDNGKVTGVQRSQRTNIHKNDFNRFARCTFS